MGSCGGVENILSFDLGEITWSLHKHMYLRIYLKIHEVAQL